MFVSIFSWLLAHVPGFMRPAVTWLLEGLRKLTNHVSFRWNQVGAAAGSLLNAVAAFRAQLVRWVVTTVTAVAWLRNVWVPRQIAAIRNALVALFSRAVEALRAVLTVAIDTVRRWARSAIDAVGAFADGVRRWAASLIARIIDQAARLVNALRHVLNGPGALSEWLIAALWRTGQRYAFAQRDRIAQWILRSSPAFTLWLTREIENVIVRWL